MHNRKSDTNVDNKTSTAILDQAHAINEYLYTNKPQSGALASYGNQVRKLTKPLTDLIREADPEALADIIATCNQQATAGNNKGTNALHWLARAICNAAYNKLSAEQMAVVSQPLITLVEKAQPDQLADIIATCNQQATAGNNKGTNALYWLARAIGNAAYNKLSAEQMTVVSQPLITLIEKAQPDQLADIIAACNQQAAAGDNKCTNALYWLACAICNAAYNKLSAEQMAVVSQPLITLVEKAQPDQLADIIATCNQQATAGNNKGTNALYWLARATFNAAYNKLSAEQMTVVSKPLLYLLDKANHKQLQTLTDAISNADAIAIIKTGAIKSVRNQLRQYLLQDRPGETTKDKLARLKTYLDKSTPLHTFLSQHTLPFHRKKTETKTVRAIKEAIANLEAELSAKDNKIKPAGLNEKNRDTFYWRDKLANIKDIEKLLNHKNKKDVMLTLEEVDDNQQTLRNYLYHEATKLTHILYLMLRNNLVQESDFEKLTNSNMQERLVELFSNTKIPRQWREEFIRLTQTPGHPVRQFLSKSPNADTLLAPLIAKHTQSQATSVTQTHAALYPKAALNQYAARNSATTKEPIPPSPTKAMRENHTLLWPSVPAVEPSAPSTNDIEESKELTTHVPLNA